MSLPVIPREQASANIDADGLHKLWLDLQAVLDAYETSIPKDKLAVLDKAVFDWQDYYFPNLGSHDADSIVKWRHAYNTAAQLLTTAIPLGAQPTGPTKSATQAKKTEAPAIFYVSGKVPPVTIKPISVPTFALPIDLSSPKWLGLLALVPIGLYLLKKKRRK